MYVEHASLSSADRQHIEDGAVAFVARAKRRQEELLAAAKEATQAAKAAGVVDEQPEQKEGGAAEVAVTVDNANDASNAAEEGTAENGESEQKGDGADDAGGDAKTNKKKKKKWKKKVRVLTDAEKAEIKAQEGPNHLTAVEAIYRGDPEWKQVRQWKKLETMVRVSRARRVVMR